MNLTKLWVVVLAWIAFSPLAHAQTNQAGGSGMPNVLGGLSGLIEAFNRSPGVTNPQSTSPLNGISGLLGGGQSAGNDIFARVNEKSKAAIDKTTLWARQKKQELTNRMTANALGSLIPGLKPQTQTGQQTSPFDWLKLKSNQPSTQPPLRSARNYEQTPSIRY